MAQHPTTTRSDIFFQPNDEQEQDRMDLVGLTAKCDRDDDGC